MKTISNQNYTFLPSRKKTVSRPVFMSTFFPNERTCREGAVNSRYSSDYHNSLSHPDGQWWSSPVGGRGYSVGVLWHGLQRQKSSNLQEVWKQARHDQYHFGNDFSPGTIFVIIVFLCFVVVGIILFFRKKKEFRWCYAAELSCGDCKDALVTAMHYNSVAILEISSSA